MDEWFVYILMCRDKTLYTGMTKDVDARMKAHKSGNGSKYVKHRGFERLLHVIKCENRSEAAKLEYKIKQMPRDSKVSFFMRHPNQLF